MNKFVLLILILVGCNSNKPASTVITTSMDSTNTGLEWRTDGSKYWFGGVKNGKKVYNNHNLEVLSVEDTIIRKIWVRTEVQHFNQSSGLVLISCTRSPETNDTLSLNIDHLSKDAIFTSFGDWYLPDTLILEVFDDSLGIWRLTRKGKLLNLKL